MKSSPLWQSFAYKASALRCAPANLSAANGSSRRRDLTISRVSAALRQTGFAATGRASASAALTGARAIRAHKAAAHPMRARRDRARRNMAGAAITTKPLLRNAAGPMLALAAECNVNSRARDQNLEPDVAPQSGRKSGDGTQSEGRLKRR